MVSVIIPVYNEEETISYCLSSLLGQTYKDIEIIIVDDGSTDNSKLKAQNAKLKNFKFLSQSHQGPGSARNLGAKHAKGDILVFVDADMTFDKDFIKKLIAPIVNNEVYGTFTKEEFVSNWQNTWARCWNYNEGISDSRRVPSNSPNAGPVFRAILKSEFDSVGGFDNIGFTDDWTLSRKLGYQSAVVPGAVCFHQNPASLKEVYIQARWIGKNEFISGTFIRRFLNLLRFNLIVQIFRSIYLSLKHQELLYIVFSLVYYTGINISILFSFFGEDKSK